MKEIKVFYSGPNEPKWVYIDKDSNTVIHEGVYPLNHFELHGLIGDTDFIFDVSTISIEQLEEVLNAID